MEETGKKSPKKMASAGRVFRMYWGHAKAHPIAISFVIIAALTLQAATLAGPLYLRKIFNILALPTHSQEAVAALIPLIGLVGAMYMLEWASRRLQTISMVVAESKIMAKLFDTSFVYLLGHSYNFFSSNFSGSLTHKVSKFSRSFETLFDSIFLQFLPTFLFVGGAVTVLYIHNHVIGLMLGIWSICFVLFQIFVARLRQPIREARAEADTKVTGTLADAISNQNTIALFSGTTYERSRFSAVVDDWRQKTTKSWLSDEYIWACIGIFMVAIEIGLLYGAVLFWKQGLFTVGDFVLMQAYLFTTFDRLVAINRELRRFFDAYSDASEMVYILDHAHEVADAKDAQKLTVKEGEINFKDVLFYFKEGSPVLDNLNLTLKSHEKVALVGPSGAGKSTITKLLLRFFDIKGGSIEIDGQNILKVTQDSLREAIAFVPQEPILFHRTLMENIRYGRRDATDEEVYEAAKKAHCHEFIAQLKDGYDTYVGERGVKLSGGERQRVAIARAILKNAPILILDEATSSLDSESEALIQDALQTLMQGKTVIVIAHRLSTIMKMDRIVVIEQGKVVATGTHEELLEQKGLYQKLWSIQAGGFITDDGTGIETPEEEEVV
ncbi:ABC transporter ATP-binding protein/permease [Patescibacteria group bacterium]|nr:ABC transporter ATP-binding protein/permease [Patescibacteria group bacterium]